MTFAALDSALLGPLFATDAMRACFSDEARLRAMLAAEAALARAEAAHGLVPDGLAGALDAIPPASLDAAAIGRATALAGVPTIPFVKAVQAQLPAEFERGFHRGATTQDILDTALALQCRDALGLVAADLAAILDGLSRLATTHRATRSRSSIPMDGASCWPNSACHCASTARTARSASTRCLPSPASSSGRSACRRRAPCIASACD